MTDETITAPSRGNFFVRKPDPDAVTLADLRRRFDAGELTAAELAREVGVSTTTIAKRLFKWGWRSEATVKAAARKKTPGRAPTPKRAGERRAKPKAKAIVDRGAARAACRVRRRPVRTAPTYDPPVEWAIDPATTPADRIATALKRLYALAERCYRALDRVIAEQPFDSEAANRLLASLIKIHAETARLEGRNGAANDADAEAGGDASPAGSDLARIKHDLVERLVSLTHGRRPADGTEDV